MRRVAILTEPSADIAAGLETCTVPKSVKKPPVEWAASTHYVYVASFEDRGLAFVKVGISDNPDSRLASLIVGSPYEFTSLFLCQAPTREKAFGLEQTILAKYAKLGTRGEWLRMKSDAVRPWVAGLSLIAMKRFGQEFLFKPHKRRRKYTPGYAARRTVRSGA